MFEGIKLGGESLKSTENCSQCNAKGIDQSEYMRVCVCACESACVWEGRERGNAYPLPLPLMYYITMPSFYYFKINVIHKC